MVRFHLSQQLNEGDFIHDTFMCFSKIAELLHTQVGLVTKASTMQCSSRRMNGLHKVLTVTKWDSLKEKIYKGVRDKLTKQALNDRIIMSWEEIPAAEIHKVYLFNLKK